MKNKKLYILLTVLLVVFCAVVVDKTFQNDTYSAIKIGDYILHNGIDFVEHFNFNELTYHNARWLFNVIVALFYNKLDFLGVYLFTIICSITLGLVIFNTLLKRNKNLLISFYITLATIGFSCSALAARAQIVSYILLFLEVIFIENLINTNKKRYLFMLIIVSVLIANIHTTIWPMVLILFLPYFAEYFVSKKFKNLKVLYSETNSIKILIISFVLVALSGLLTPLGLLPYTYMFKTLIGDSSLYINELHKVNIFFNSTMLILTITYVYLFIYLRKKIKISDLFLICGLYFMAIMALRNVMFFVIIGSICLSRTIMNSLEDKKEEVDTISNAIYKDKVIMTIFILPAIVLTGFFIYKNIYNKPYVDETSYPVEASDYILDNLDLDNLRLYNDFNNGSYLEFRGIKVFIDSRSEIYCKEFNNTDILSDFILSNELGINYKDVFSKYNFTHILLYNNETLNQYVMFDEDYEIIYRDKYFVLYKKVE